MGHVYWYFWSPFFLWEESWKILVRAFSIFLENFGKFGYLVQLIIWWKFGTGQPNNVSILLTIMLIKFGVWPTIMMVQNLCLFQKTKVYICIAYLFDQNRNTSKVQIPMKNPAMIYFFNLRKWPIFVLGLGHNLLRKSRCYVPIVESKKIQ